MCNNQKYITKIYLRRILIHLHSVHFGLIIIKAEIKTKTYFFYLIDVFVFWKIPRSLAGGRAEKTNGHRCKNQEIFQSTHIFHRKITDHLWFSSTMVPIDA